MNIQSIKQNTLKTILQFSIPAIVAMVLTSLITVVDGFFVGNYVGSAGIAAINLGLPIIYLFLAVGLMISVGGVAIAGILLGKSDLQSCNAVFNQTICTTVIASLALSGCVWIFFDTFLAIVNADAQVSAYFKQYYRVMLFYLPLMVINSAFGMFIRSEGNPQYFMKVNIVNVLLNIFLDYIFVRWFNLGVMGVAIASLISMLVCFCLTVYFFIKKSTVYKFKKFTFSRSVFKSTFLNGSSEFIGEMSLCISIFAYNLVIMKYVGVDGITAFAVVGYISYIFSMIIIGFGQGASPLISFCYGANEYPLVQAIRKLTNVLVFLAGTAVFIFVVCAGGWYSTLFVKNTATAQMILNGAKIFAVSFLFSGINTVTSFYFTSISKALPSAIISFARGLVVLLICIFTLPSVLGMTGVWLVAPITEIITIVLSIIFICRYKSAHTPNIQV